MNGQMMMDSQTDGVQVSDGDRWSDGWITGLALGVTDGYVNDKLTEWQTDWLYDGWTGMMDRLAVSWTDSGTDGQVN